MPAAFAIADLGKKRLQISQLKDLNDPFELLAVELPDRKMRQRFLKIKRNIARQHGVVCFSKNWSNPVIWSHYADKHRGICLGFDVPDDPILHISYDGGRLLLNILHRAVTNQFISKASLWYTMRHERNRWEKAEA